MPSPGSRTGKIIIRSSSWATTAPASNTGPTRSAGWRRTISSAPRRWTRCSNSEPAAPRPRPASECAAGAIHAPGAAVADDERVAGPPPQRSRGRCGPGALLIAAVGLDRQPVLFDRRGRRRKSFVDPCAVDHLSADHGQHRLQVLDRVLRNLEVIRRQKREVREPADLDRSFLVLLAGDPRARRGVHAARPGAVA